MGGRFIRSSIYAGKTIIVNETYPRREGKGFTRAKYKGTTSAAQEKYNEKLAARKLTALINANFTAKDWHITLTYKRECRPTPDNAEEILRRFKRELRALYKKQKATLKYIVTTAYGNKGGIHHHIIVSGGVDTAEIRELWEQYGSVRPVGLYDTGDYSALAWYFVTQAKQGLKPDEMLNNRKWSCSKNLKRPEAEEQVINEINWREPPIAKRGYYIDPDSVDAGINEQTGIPYLYYIQVKLPKNAVAFTPDGRLLKDDAAAKYIRQRARDEVKAHLDKIRPYGEVIRKNKGGDN